MFGFVNIFYGLLVPVMLVQFLSLIFIPSLIRGGDPKKVAEAVYCYTMQSFGVLLMTAGALPTVVSVLAGMQMAGSTYFTLLVVFAAGGIMFLWHDNAVRCIDPAARQVPGAIFLYMFKIIGYIIVLLWGLSLFTTLMSGSIKEEGWWILPLVMVLYGLLLSWCTRVESGDATQSVFQSITMNPSMAVSRKAAKRPSVRKK